MPFTGYAYVNKKIITIKVLNDKPKPCYSNEIKEENKLYVEYYTANYEILQVEDVDGNILNEKVKLQGEIHYYLTKEVPINRINYRIFFDDKNILGKEFSGIQKMWYYTGQLHQEFFHINGKEFGEYKKYDENGQLWIECVYVDGKIEGEYKKYDVKGNLKKIDYYVAGDFEIIEEK
jgi:antitoxin component YwqK of YwqJK toxin-antitoxin module